MLNRLQLREIQDQVNALLELDYDIDIVDNSSGFLCNSYPLDIVLLKNEKLATLVTR